MKKSNVGLRLSHKIQPKQFESLEVSLYVEEEVEYGDDSKREAAIDAFSAKVLGDFRRSFDLVESELSVKEKPVAVTQVTADKTVKTTVLPVAPVEGAKKTKIAPSKSELDDFFDKV